MNYLKPFRKIWRHIFVYALMPLVNRPGRQYFLASSPDVAGRLSPETMRELRKIWETGRTGNNRGDWSRLYFFAENVRMIRTRGIDGALAELGVFKGTTAKLLHKLLPERELFLFDTFEGFDPRDTQSDPSGFPSGDYCCGLSEVKRFVGNASTIKWCKGFFPDTTAMVPEDTRFALIHLDCDLYNPTIEALRFFYDRLNPGGIVIVHDYAGDCWPGIRQAVDEFLSDKPEYPIIIPDRSGTAVFIKAATDSVSTLEQTVSAA